MLTHPLRNSFFLYLLPVFYRSVKGPASRVASALVGRIQLFRVICQLNTDTRCLRDHHAAVFKTQRLFHHLILRAV